MTNIYEYKKVTIYFNSNMSITIYYYTLDNILIHNHAFFLLLLQSVLFSI